MNDERAGEAGPSEAKKRRPHASIGFDATINSLPKYRQSLATAMPHVLEFAADQKGDS